MKKTALRLRNDVFYCYVNNEAIFLDLRSDSYFGLDHKSSSSLRQLENGDSSLAPNELKESQIFTPAPSGKLLSATSLRPAQFSASSTTVELFSPSVLPGLNAFLGTRLILSFLKVSLITSLIPTARYLANIAHRYKDKSAATVSKSELDTYVRYYSVLRPILYRARDNCLFDSLVLRDFLRRCNVEATVVIGVKTAPFMAHAWVQCGEYTVNSPAEFSASFTPIAVA